MLTECSTMRLTSDSGRKLRRKTPRPAMLESVENAMHETLRPRATWAVAGTEAANSGPRMISAPSSSACCAPCWAPWGLPPSSLIRSWMLEFRQRHLASVFHRLRGDAGIARRRQRQQQPDLDLPIARNGRLLGWPSRSGAFGAGEGIGKLLRAAAGREQGDAQQKTDCRPPRRAQGRRCGSISSGFEWARHHVSGSVSRTRLVDVSFGLERRNRPERPP
jgi:hypothetical protein